MKILITGSKGQLGLELTKQLEKEKKLLKIETTVSENNQKLEEIR